IGEDGKRHELYGDRVYALYSYPAYSLAAETATNDSKQVVTTFSSRGEDKALDSQVADLSKWCLKAHGETIAFQRAKACGAVPEGFDPLAIGPRCFYGDRASAFRGPGGALPPSVPAQSWPRTNFPRVFDQARLAHPRLGKLLDASLAKLSTDAETAIARRASYVTEQV